MVYDYEYKIGKENPNRSRIQKLWHFFSNRDDDFPEDPLGLLFEGNFEKGAKRLEIWGPFVDMEPLELAKLIEIARQIIFTKGIPFSLTIPTEPRTLDSMLRGELDSMLQHSYEQSLAGKGRPFEEVFDELERGLA